MSGIFHVFDVAASGAKLSTVWLDVLADNIANQNTIHPADEEPFRAKLIYAREKNGPSGLFPFPATRTGKLETGDGVTPLRLIESTGESQAVYDPTHPLADEEGRVWRPVVDLAAQMTDLILAGRSYTMNIQVLQHGREAYEAAMRIGS